ncbi:MAG: M4 family metallopeptidase [Bacteroidota bacterium]
MKKLSTLALVALSISAIAQDHLTGQQAQQVCPVSKSVIMSEINNLPSWIFFKDNSYVPGDFAMEELRQTLQIGEDQSFKIYRKETDQLGYVHTRYQQYYKGVKVEGGEYLVHERGGFTYLANGCWFDGINVGSVPVLTEEQALGFAVQHIDAVKYKWEIAEEEAWLKYVWKDPSKTYYPKGELIIALVNDDFAKKDFRLAYKFDIYAAEPMSRNYVYVDALTGEVINKRDRIHHADVPAGGITMYAGNQTWTADQVNPTSYRLRETARGQGLETYNLLNGTNYGNAVDFTDSDNNWTSTANDDHAAHDAHWGAEATYDYYGQIHSRNGIDNNGMLMLSYVHYSNNYNNAFWNGSEMTYGDGSGTAGGFNPLTALDVCGHEFTHGVTEFSSNLVYSYQSGALNESFSDIFGTCIEFWKTPSLADFLIGEQITVTQPSALRSMSNPNQYGDPDCYLGTNWYTGTGDNGGVHTNSGVQNYWFYLLCVGGSGTNDVNNAFSVTGIGIANAERIAYRNNNVYLTSNSQYIDARTGSIQAAQDLFGACTPEVIATTNAWYACNVGPQYSAVVTSSFTASSTTSCSLPFTVNFTNTSINATSAVWDFGDNSTGTNYNETHTYTQPGVYTVQLTVTSTCGTSTTTQTSYININTPAAPATTGAVSCTSPASVTLSATGTGTLEWFTQPTGGTSINTGTTYTTPSLSATTTYYVENQTPGSTGNVGPVNNSFGGGGNHNSTTNQYLIFDVLQPCTLQTVWVNSSTAGNRTIRLWDNAGNVVQTMTVNIPNGQNTIALNLPLSPGTGYRLGGNSMNLYRNNSGPSYPYTLNGVVNITNSSAGANYYYYFYDWQVTTAPCTSVRTPVVATIGGPAVTYAAPVDTACINTPAFVLAGGSPSGGTYSGPGVSGGVFDPSVAGIGTHTITYTYTDVNGCTGTATQTIYVDACAGIDPFIVADGFSVYPNPSSGSFTVAIGLTNSEKVELVLLNTLGQAVISASYELSAGLNTIEFMEGGLAKGVYLIQVRTSEQMLTKRIEIK